jgi:UDP-N-acetylmuramate dehydrogenase
MNGTVDATAPSLAALDALAAERGISLTADAPLAALTTLRVGGKADRLATAATAEELLAALRLGRDAAVPTFILGNGSDLVVADAGMRGLVIRNRSKSVLVEGERIAADSGAAMAMLVRRCTAAGLAGLEFGISIPGTLGGAIWANAGAHGGEMRDILLDVDVWDAQRGAVLTLDNTACAFDYRESRFKHAAEVILAARLSLNVGDAGEIAARVAQHQAQRIATQPLADQNAGSVFRNPPGDHAGRLIDAAGLKGTRVGTASVSTLHANFIVTERGGRAADVRALGERVRVAVRDRFDVELQYEIEFVGEWDAPVPEAADA